MSARRIALAAAAGGALLLGPVGCGSQESDVEEVTVEAPSIEVDDEPDGWDCERSASDNERSRKEQPDCGRYVRGRWVEWSWVAGGRTSPPVGWSERTERASDTPATASPAPQRTTRSPAPKRSRR